MKYLITLLLSCSLQLESSGKAFRSYVSCMQLQRMCLKRVSAAGLPVFFVPNKEVTFLREEDYSHIPHGGNSNQISFLQFAVGTLEKLVVLDPSF